MKTLIVVFAMLLSSVPVLAEELTNLKKCQKEARLSEVKKADDLERKFEQDLRKAHADIAELQAVCKQYAAETVQLGGLREKVEAARNKAGTSAQLARASGNAAKQQLDKISPDLVRIGVDNCASEVNTDSREIDSVHLKQMMDDLKAIQCSPGAQSPAPPAGGGGGGR